MLLHSRLRILLFFLFVQSGLSAQEQHINLTLAHDPLEQFIVSVYGEEWVAHNQEAATYLVRCVNERVRYVQLPLSEDKYPLLSSFPLMNKNNPEIVAIDYAAFDPNTFIPLTYNLPFFSNKTEMVRVDGTEYVIVIEPQKK